MLSESATGSGGWQRRLARKLDLLIGADCA